MSAILSLRDWLRSIAMRFLPTGQQDNAKLLREYREGKR